MLFCNTAGNKKKKNNLMNTSTKQHFVFESEGKAVPLMKITEVLTDSFFAINTLWH